MSKITIPDIASQFASQEALNARFTQVENEFNNKVLYRDNPDGEPNAMAQELDMNSNRVINLPEPVHPNDAARLQDVTTSSLDPDTVIATQAEAVTLTAGQTTVVFATYGTEGSSFNLSGPDTDDSRLVLGRDFLVTNSTTIQLSQSYPAGTTLQLLRNAIAGEDALVIQAQAAYDTVAQMKLDSIVAGTLIQTKGYYVAGDGGERSYLVAASQTVDGYRDHALAGGTVALLQSGGSVNVRDFGAVGDGVTDDTEAFNAFAAAIRAAVTDYGQGAAATDTVAITFLIPPGDYSVSTVNFTNIRLARNVFITGHNANLIANAAGKTVLDCVGSRWLWFVGLTVVSPSGVVAKHGIQFGNVGGEACGNNKLQFVQCLGDYSLSAYANYGSETTHLFSCRFSNDSSTVESYAAYMDGEGNKIPASDYATITKTVGTAVSFTNNAHFGCQFRHLGAGSSVYLARCTGWSFDDSSYFLAFDEANVVIYATNTSRTPDLVLGGLFETSQAPGVKDCIRFVGDATNTNVAGLTFKPSAVAVVSHIINNTTGALVSITEADLSIVSVSNPGGTLKLVNTNSGISIVGDYKSRMGAADNFSDLTRLGGNVFVVDKSLVTIPANTFGFVFDQITGGVDAYNMTVIP